MISTLDFLYLVIAISVIVLTCVATMVGIELLRTVRDVRRMADNVEKISTLAHQVALVLLPGVGKTAGAVGAIERQVSQFFKKVTEKK